MQMTITKAIKLSLLALTKPQILIRLLIPLFASFILAIAAVIALWTALTSASTEAWFKSIEMFAWVMQFYSTTFGSALISLFFYLFLFAIFFAFLYLTTILLTSLLIVPLLSSVVQRLYFPELKKQGELTIRGSLWNSVKAIMVFITVFVLCSPLLFIPGMQIILPLVLNAYLVRKLFLYDVLQDFATKAEYIRINVNNAQSLWKLSLMTGAYLFVPVLNILAPVLIALAFLMYGLGLLQAERTEKT